MKQKAFPALIMRNKLLGLLLLTTSFAQADTESTFFAETISFDGQALSLSQGVQLQHPLGDFSAQTITFQNPSTDLSAPFTYATLQGNVSLLCKDGKRATCHTAVINQTQHTIQLQGARELSFAMPYQDALMELFCEEINASYKTQDHKIELNQIDATSHVHFAWQNSSFFADALHLEDLGGEYLIQAFSQNKTSRCKLLYEASVVHSSRIQYETKTKELFLERPQGLLPVGFISGAKQQLSQFSSETLLWNLERKTLSLIGEVQIVEKDTASLETSESMTIQYSKDNSAEWSIDQIVSHGYSRVTAIDPNQLQHEISCHKKILFEKSEQKILMESPLTPTGEIIEGRQIRYEGMNMAIYGTKGIILLKEKQKKMGIHQILLEGSIRLFSHDPKNHSMGAIADEMIVQTDKQLVTLLAKGANKVLYVDEKEGVFVSAKKIVIYNPSSKSKKTVRAFGSVKFCFNAQENALLKKIFPYLHLPQAHERN